MFSKNLRLSFASNFLSRRFASSEYDLAIIGGGPGGYVAAIKAGQKGLKTICIEKRGTLGGTCLNVGCIPSKALLTVSNYYHKIHSQFPKFGINCEKATIDIQKMMKHKETTVGALVGGIEYLFKKNKVDYAIGTGEFIGKNDIQINLNKGGSEKIKAKNIMIATGSDVSPIPGEPIKIDEQTVLSSTGALSLTKTPKNLIVIGAGVIGMELGSVWRNCGAEVTVVEYLDKIIPFCDGEVSSTMLKMYKKDGINFMLNSKVVGGSVGSSGAQVIIEDNKTKEKKTLEAEKVLVATGRIPYTKGLKAESIGLKFEKQGRIEINEKYQTNIPHIYAIGDVVKGPMLAHKAEEEGIATVENILNEHGHVNYGVIPGVIYTHPEIAYVGKTEEELKKEGVDYAKGVFPFSANGRAKAMMEADGFVKVLTDKKTDKILGVHMVSSVAGEAISEAVLAMEYGGAGEDIGRTCHAHPTMSEALKEACMACYDKAIHI